MSRRIAAALLSFLALALLPAAAAAQAPDERANARAFADITMRAVADMQAATAQLEGDIVSGPPRCKATRRLMKRGTERQIAAVFALYGAEVIRELTRALTPVLARTVTELHGVPTADPALRSGRTAWRRIHRVYARFAAYPRVRFCSEVRDYVRADFRPTRAMRKLDELYRQAERWDTTDVDRRLARGVERLVELGVPADDADAFDGEIDHSGGRGEARAAQAPAPSSPLTSPRAAR